MAQMDGKKNLAIQCRVGLAYFLLKTATAFLLVLPNIWADRERYFSLLQNGRVMPRSELSAAD